MINLPFTTTICHFEDAVDRIVEIGLEKDANVSESDILAYIISSIVLGNKERAVDFITPCYQDWISAHASDLIGLGYHISYGNTEADEYLVTLSWDDKI